MHSETDDGRGCSTQGSAAVADLAPGTDPLEAVLHMSSSSSSLAIGVLPDRDRVVVAAGGELDVATSVVLRDALRELRDSGWRNFALDLRDVTFMDSAGVHVVLDLLDEAGRHGGEVAVVRSSAAVDRVFGLLGLGALLPSSAHSRRGPPRRRGRGGHAPQPRLPTRR